MITYVDMETRVDEIRNRWPTVGLAVGVVHDGSLEHFSGHGLADIASNRPVTADTGFRIASVTKTFTAIAVMQLWERGLVDLDASAGDYLDAFRLVPARPGFRPATLRHLLTHTAGIREVLHPSGLLRMRDLGETVPAGRRVPSLVEYYRGGLRIDAEPGRRFMYTNHGFAVLGQIVADLTGEPLDRYLRTNVFAPLGMHDTGLGHREHMSRRLATGYELRARGAAPVADYEVVPVGAGAAWSTPRDMARYLAALLQGGANEHGRVLKPETLALMFAPHHQPDTRLPGMGLAFFRADLGGHATVEHDGILPGFDAQILLAPDDGVGVLAFANGAKRGMHWLVPETARLLGGLLGAPAAAIRTDVAQRPEIWAGLCGRYQLSAHRTDPARLALGPGADVVVRRGELRLKFRSPIPALRRGFRLHPDDGADPYVFRISLPWLGIGTSRVVFSRQPGAGTTAVHFEFAPLSLRKVATRTR